MRSQGFCPGDGAGLDRTVDHVFWVSLLWYRATPWSSHSTSDGNTRWLSPPKRMEIWPEWEEVEVFVKHVHLAGVGKENPEPLIRSSLMAESLRVFPLSLNLISVVRMTLPSLA